MAAGLFRRSSRTLGNPNPLEDGGKPDIRQSNRGLGTGLRISVPVLNLHKTRLNDPHLSFLGTNDHPGDYRSSGCTACHVIYANDRDPFHAGPYATYGHLGRSATADPTIPRDEAGHPIKHTLTRAIPSSQCIVCHMHQPNVFLNTFLGYTMWDYETDAARSCGHRSSAIPRRRKPGRAWTTTPKRRPYAACGPTLTSWPMSGTSMGSSSTRSLLITMATAGTFVRFSSGIKRPFPRCARQGHSLYRGHGADAATGGARNHREAAGA